MRRDTKDTRESLVGYFGSAAGFRESLIPKDQPWNLKNEKYAVRLNAIVAYLMALPEDDPTLRMLADCNCLHDELAGFVVPDDEWQSVIHCGSDDPVAWFQDWARGLVERQEN